MVPVINISNCTLPLHAYSRCFQLTAVLQKLILAYICCNIYCVILLLGVHFALDFFFNWRIIAYRILCWPLPFIHMNQP